MGDETASLVYYTDFEFGEHTYQVIQGATYDAIAPIFTSQSGKQIAMPNFLQVNNSPEAKDWKVSVKAGQFKSVDNKKSLLSGAQIDLKDVEVVTQLGNEAKTNSSKYTLTPENSIIISSYEKPSDDEYLGMSINSIIFGDVSETTNGEEDESGEQVTYNPGVQLTLPSVLSISDNTKYLADLEWSIESTI